MARLRRLTARNGTRRLPERGLAGLGRWTLAIGLLLSLAAAPPGRGRGQAASAWSPQSVGSADLNAVAAVPGTSTAWAVGDAGAIYATTDGSTWAPQAVGTTTRHLRAVAASAPDGRAPGDRVPSGRATDAGSTVVWAVGDGGTILR